MGLSKNSAVERRTAQCQRITYRLDVSFPDGCTGCLLDISASGLRIRFKHAMDAGTVQSMRLEFPKWLELGAGLEVTGRFVWIRALPAGGNDAGFAFDGLSRKDTGVLAVLIQRLSEALDEGASVDL